MVPVERAELVTKDMDLIAELIRDLHVEHEAAFSCPDPARVDGRVRSVTASGLTASLVRYGGFEYSAEVEPVNPPMAVVCTGNSGVITTAREDLRLARGDVFMTPTDLPSVTAVDEGDYATLRVPWAVVGSVAEAVTGASAADLRFEAMAPVSAARQRMFARTAELVGGQLVTSGTAGMYPLVLQELTRLTAAALGDADPASNVTVALIARRWGWASHSQFTVAYRKRFGVP